MVVYILYNLDLIIFKMGSNSVLTITIESKFKIMCNETVLLIENLYKKNYLLLYNYAYSELHSIEQAEDAVQEVFAILCSEPETLHNSTNQDRYIFKTLKSVIKSTVKLNESIEKLDAKIGTQLLSNTQITFIDLDVSILFADLAEKDSFVLIKEIVINKYSIYDMSEDLGISLASCKKIILKAISELKKSIHDPSNTWEIM